MRVPPLLILIACSAILTGCQTTPRPYLSTFDPAEYEPYTQAGTGAVTGQAFIRLARGGAMLASGREVFLRPATTYSTEFIQRAAIAYEVLESADERVRQFQRSTVADADGRFRFEGLPAGEYYLTCYIEWEVPTGTYYGGVATRKESDIAYGRVAVKDGETARVVVTR